MLHGAEIRRKKPCLFPCKVAAAGDERYLACAAGAGWLPPSLGVVRTVLAASMCFAYSFFASQLDAVLESLLRKQARYKKQTHFQAGQPDRRLWWSSFWITVRFCYLVLNAGFFFFQIQARLFDDAFLAGLLQVVVQAHEEVELWAQLVVHRVVHDDVEADL